MNAKPEHGFGNLRALEIAVECLRKPTSHTSLTRFEAAKILENYLECRRRGNRTCYQTMKKVRLQNANK